MDLRKETIKNNKNNNNNRLINKSRYHYEVRRMKNTYIRNE
jgi:hypothetical protein